MYPSMKLSPYPDQYNAYNPRAASLRNEDDERYIVTTKIMVIALAVLFAVVFFVVCLHIYAKWVRSTTPTRLSFSFWRRRRNRDEIVLDADALDINIVMGLGKAAVEALPKFRYEECEHHLECPICLGKFEEGEMGRALPKCGHCFHLECIDMWLLSHSTCPLCRAVLDPDVEVDSIAEVFHLEPPSPEPIADSLLPEEDQGDKRADAIPANVLFWGNHTQGPPSLELARISISNNSSASPQIVIDVEQVADSRPRGGSLHRLLGRGGRVVSNGSNVVVTPFRPSTSPSPSSSSRVSSGASSHGDVFSAEEP